MIFKALTEGEYHAAVPEHSIEFRVARLRYERHELHGELTVSCGLAGARSFDDACISSSTMNLSSAMTRQSTASDSRIARAPPARSTGSACSKSYACACCRRNAPASLP